VVSNSVGTFCSDEQATIAMTDASAASGLIRILLAREWRSFIKVLNVRTMRVTQPMEDFA
jgi:hypothetical protein